VRYRPGKLAGKRREFIYRSLLHVTLAMNFAFFVVLAPFFGVPGYFLSDSRSDARLCLLSGVGAAIVGLVNFSPVSFLSSRNAKWLRRTALVLNLAGCLMPVSLLSVWPLHYWTSEWLIPLGVVELTCAGTALWWVLCGSPPARLGECSGCGYSLAGIPGERCPECGLDQRESIA
jgi:hypothetical protein